MNDPILSSLNPRQADAVQRTEGPLIVLAGAGSGKTKMLTSRIAWLIDRCGVAPHHILAVTFTNKAAAEMRERVGRILGISFDAVPWSTGSWMGIPEIGTFHSVCLRILRREAMHTPFTKPFVIYDDSDQLSLVKSVVDKLGIDEKQFSPKGIQSAINSLKCDAIEPQDMAPDRHHLFDRQVKRVYEQYQKDLFANNAIDFGEILCMTYRLFRDHPEVRARYQARFKYIHVDEYQDTNRAQYLLLSMLAKAEFGGHENICVVGDEDQSIYKWRGADIRNILDFERDYPGAQVVKLEQNYRSTQTIIRAASHVIRNNRQRKDKTLFTENIEGELIQRYQVADERAEAELVVSEIKRLTAAEDRRYSDFAIFYRTNAQSRQFEDVLRREKIPYQIVGGLRFYDRKEIKDILSYFKVVLNPTDSISLKRIINTPARGIGKTTIDKIEELQLQLSEQGEPGSDTSLWAALQLASREGSITSAGTARKLAAFVDLIQKLMVEQPKLLLSEFYHLVLDEIAYVRELRNEGTEESLARIENLEEFDTLLQEFEEDVLETVPESERAQRLPELLTLFLEQSALVSDPEPGKNVQASGELGPSVKMMTLHSSKGLEFPVVFLVGMEEGLFPSVKAWQETTDEDIEEERRLCYVGITRAREVLYLMHATMRRIWGNFNYQEPARFLDEIPNGLVKMQDVSRGGGGHSYRLGSSRHVTPRSVVQSAKYDDDWDDSGVEGRWLEHPEYGRGKIVASEGSGMEARVTIDFSGGGGRRKFLWRYVAAYLLSG
ncbi:MAG: ATP-dependent helicase [Oligoflexia bacterium]|jgi:DNA helicase-2/ATP-dependent DNA helicase PcrA